MSGKIHRLKKESDFVTLDNHALRNKELSWKGKGLHSYLMHLPDDWQINIADLQNRSDDGRDSTAAGLRELIKAGYVTRTRVIDGKTKQFIGYDYNIYERPEHAIAVNGKAVNGLSVTGKAEYGKPVTNKDTVKVELKEVKIKGSKDITPQAAVHITTHTPTEFENVEVVIVEGQAFDLEEKTNLEPITPAAGKKPRTPKTAGNNITAVCAEISDDMVLVFFHGISEAWGEWIDYKRRERKGTYKTAKTEAATIAALAKAVNYDPEAGRAAIEHSIAQTYAGIYPDKKFANDTNVARYSLEDRPQATTPTEMVKEAISFYQQNPKVWRDATLFGKVTEWTQEKHKDFLLKFCARQIADGRGRDTFGEINARLQAWFLNENKHQNPAQQQHTAGPQPQAPLRSAAPVNYSPTGPVLRAEKTE